jgi:Ca2+-binding RTX toxin-like protein
MSSLALLLGGRPLTASLITRALNSLYSNIGRNLDERNWGEILASADPLSASESALQAMYQNHGYLLRNAENLAGIGYTDNQIAYTYQLMAARLGFVYQSTWAVGSRFESAATLALATLRNQAATDQQNSLPVPVLTLSNDALGLLAQADANSRLEFANGGFIANLTAAVDVALGELGALTSGKLVAVNANGGRSAQSTQTVTLGTAGNDIYDASGAGAVVQYVSTGGGDDLITGGPAADILYAGLGNDTIRGGQEDVRIDGGGGTDTLELFANFTVAGIFQVRGFEDIVLQADGLTLSLAGSFSTANLRGFATGSSTITGSNGPDVFFGGTGADVFSGGSDQDTFTGGAGNDSFTGGLDNDTFHVDEGTDTITDLQAEDVFVIANAATLNATVAQEYSATAASRNLGGSAANAVFRVSINADTADFSLVTVANAATQGLTLISENIFGGVTITGSIGNDIINGQQVLAVTETLRGNDGNDTMTAGIGPDIITGGAGADVLVFYAGASRNPSATSFDTITDFGTGADSIDWTGAALNADAGTGTGLTLNAAGLVTAGAANLADFVTALGNSTTTTAGSTMLFASGADSYLFISDGNAGLGANDVLVKITGIAATTGLTFVGGNIWAIA